MRGCDFPLKFKLLVNYLLSLKATGLKQEPMSSQSGEGVGGEGQSKTVMIF